MNITRRGFLSLFATLPVATRPTNAEAFVGGRFERIAKIIPNAAYGKFNMVERYVFTLLPETMEAIRPGGVTLLRGIPDRVFKPDRLMLSSPGFNLLHLATNKEPILQDEIESDYFCPANVGFGIPRLEMAHLEPGQEIIIAAVNRNKEPAVFTAALMGPAVDASPETIAEYPKSLSDEEMTELDARVDAGEFEDEDGEFRDPDEA